MLAVDLETVLQFEKKEHMHVVCCHLHRARLIYGPSVENSASASSPVSPGPPPRRMAFSLTSSISPPSAPDPRTAAACSRRLKSSAGMSRAPSLFLQRNQSRCMHAYMGGGGYGIYSLNLGYCQKRGSNFHQYLSYKKASTIVGVAVLPGPSLLDNEEERKKMCERYGFTQIGEPLPDNIILKDIVTTLPKEVFEIDDKKAWKSVLISLTSYALGIFMISKAPWYLLPFAWAWAGTAVSGFFGIGHECGHRSFSRNKLLEDIVGTIAFLPLIYPFEPWRIKHDRHHAKTNMLEEDTGWLPALREDINSSLFLRNSIVFGLGPLRPWASIAHWWVQHFDLKKFRPNEVGRVKISLACVFAFIVVGWPLIVYTTGIVGWIKFWFMPWMVYHFWMSTVTMIHHTAPHIPFKTKDKWNSTRAQFGGTVHCNYPRWVEILFHDINVHIPHHLSPRIPSYNLRAAHQSLQANWGKYLTEANWNWRLMKTLMTICHVYDEEKNYIPLEEIAPDVSRPIKLLRKVMPDYA